MKNLGLLIFLLGLSLPFWGQASSTCAECKTIDQLGLELEETQRAYQMKRKEMKEAQVAPIVTDEQKHFELAQSNIYRAVCDFQSSNREVQSSLVRLVHKLYTLKVDSDATADTYQCFYSLHKNSKGSMQKIITAQNLQSDFAAILREGKPDHQ